MNNPSPLEVVLFMGLQGSGKSSFYRQHFAESHLHLSLDLWPNLKKPRQRLLRLLEDALKEGRSVVVDNTHPTREDRAPLLHLADVYRARRVGYCFIARLEDCLERNRGREGRARVPDVALYSTAKRLQHPTLEEGFDALYAVRLDPQAGFALEPWREEKPHERR